MYSSARTKNGEGYYDISTPESYAASLLDIFADRYRWGWYDSPQDVKEMELIASCLEGKVTSIRKLLESRRDFEYEGYAIMYVTSYRVKGAETPEEKIDRLECGVHEGKVIIEELSSRLKVCCELATNI